MKKELSIQHILLFKRSEKHDKVNSIILSYKPSIGYDGALELEKN